MGQLRGEREIVINAPPPAIMAVFADVASLPSWSRIHKSAKVIDTYPPPPSGDGLPRRVRVVYKLLGFAIPEDLECQWGEDWLAFEASDQRVRYTLAPEAGRTRVRVEVEIVPTVPIPGFLLRRGTKLVLDAATEDLRKRVEN